MLRCYVLASSLARAALTGQSGAVARIAIADSSLVVRLNPLEAAMAVRRTVTVPLAAVRRVSVEDRPLTSSSVMHEVEMSFAAGGAPGMTFATVGPRARFRDGRALIVVWRNSRSVIVELIPNETPWRLLVISLKNADLVAERLRVARAP